jgi:glycosyltransferase involved in cell wall biosynthesis
MGIVKTLNRLLDAVPEDINFIARLDADDICLYDRLERQLAFLEAHPSIGGVGSSLIIINEKSQVTGRRIYPCQKEEIRRKLPYSNQLAHPSMMLRKESIRKAGYYSSGYNGCEDYELWLRMLEYADFSNLGEPVIKYRISSGQCKQQHLKSTLKNTVKIQREYFKRIGHRIPFTLFVQHWVGFVLLLLPSQWILTLFCLLAYKKQDK